jgi:hypothetical protein
MKNLLSFEDFVNESLIVEGVMASKAFKDLYDSGKLEGAWDSDLQPFAEEIAKKLGVKSSAEVIQADENTAEESALGKKIYNFLEKKFNTTEDIENDYMDAEYDKVLNVVRTSDMGFIAYQFVASSKF